MNIRAYIKEIRTKGKRCFTIQDVVDTYGVSRGLVRVCAHRLLKSGDLISPVRGLYVIVPPEAQPYGSIPAKELVPLIAQHLKADYYVSLLSAGLFYGATHQKPGQFQVISDKRIKRQLRFGAIEIQFIYKKSLVGLPTRTFTVPTGYLNAVSYTHLDVYKRQIYMFIYDCFVKRKPLNRMPCRAKAFLRWLTHLRG